MKLVDVPDKTRVFVDSNIFIYHFTGVSDECTEFLTRCEQGNLVGFTSTGVIAEVLHRLMIVEAVRKQLVMPPNMVRKLARSPEKVKALTEHFIYTQKIPEMGIEVIPFTWDIVSLSHALRLEYGLMVNDSFIISCMYRRNINALASGDKAFKKVKGIELFEPSNVGD